MRVFVLDLGLWHVSQWWYGADDRSEDPIQGLSDR